MKIIAILILIFLLFILFKKLNNKIEHFTHLFDFNSNSENTNEDIVTLYINSVDTSSFHPKFVIKNEKKESYLFINDFWEMHDLNVNIQDKNKKIVSTIVHYNYNIYNFKIEGKSNKFQFLNNNSNLFVITSDNKDFQFTGSMSNLVIKKSGQEVGSIVKEDEDYKIELYQSLEDYKNIIAIGYIIYLQLLKEQSHISI
jgi:hypothetical protein